MSLIEQYREWLAEVGVPCAPSKPNKVDSAARDLVNNITDRNYYKIRSAANRLGPGGKKRELVSSLRDTRIRDEMIRRAAEKARGMGFKNGKKTQ